MNEQENVGCIVGAVLQLMPNSETQVQCSLLDYTGVEIHTKDAQARWVITIEASTSYAAMKISESIQNLEGILSFSPVYQYCDNHSNDQQLGGWQWR